MSTSIEEANTQHNAFPLQESHLGEMILVVEDDISLLKLIEKCLERHGFHVVGAANGETALRWLDANSPRLMLLDYSLPDMRGEELLDRLEASGRRIPFVVATGHGSESVAVEMMKRGACDYLTKGPTFMKLLPTVLEQVLTRVRQSERLVEAEEKLQEAHNELEQRVRQRTAELAEVNQRLRVEIDERCRAEEELQRHQAELAHVTRLSTMGEMVAELAHELNQPLSAISSYSQACQRLLRLGAADHAESLMTSLNQVGEQADRAAGIIRRLKRFVTKAKPAQVVLEINSLVREVAEILQFDARLADAHVRFEFLDPLPQVTGDRIQVEQVMVNLMHNAFESMRDAKQRSCELLIRTAMHDAKHIVVAVCDTGIGIAPESRPQIFDRFFTTKADGMGMGLPISQSIIESHGGRLWVEPNSDRGVTFFFTLPIDFGDKHCGE